jgi:hypothetical protein
MAARVARQLEEADDFQVETVAGGLGEFIVFVDDQEVINTNRLWYPWPSRVVAKVREQANK